MADSVLFDCGVGFDDSFMLAGKNDILSQCGSVNRWLPEAFIIFSVQ